MKDPSIQQIMSDPIMRQASDHLRVSRGADSELQVLDEMQSNPTSAAKHMQVELPKHLTMLLDVLCCAGPDGQEEHRSAGGGRCVIEVPNLNELTRSLGIIQMR